ncbi:MAG TPA: site-2 protease family protein [Candidatus Saccharimonadales bacterium]|nr:site-2 protease family protein [Candidatus Saccharimonadales bacterium]
MLTGFGPMDIFFNLLISMGVLWFSISIHEAAHAWTALQLGDPTAKYEGRVSLNPLDHIDPIGTVLLPLIMYITHLPMFGWAKPTPFNPWNLKNPKRDAALISFAGPVSNLLIAIVFSIIFRLLHPGGNILGLVLFNIVYLNVVLAIFNLIPIHPLDGFKVVGGFLPKNTYLRWLEFERFGPYFLILVFFFGGSLIQSIVNPVMQLLLG